MDRKIKPNAPGIQIKNQALEEAMQNFKGENNKENLQKLTSQLMAAKVLVPAKPEKPIPPYVLEKMKKGEKLKPEEAPRFHPLIIKNAKEELFIPAYTSQASLPTNQKYEGVLTIPFVDVAAMATKPDTKLKGVVLNPVSHNLTVHPPLMEAMVKQVKLMKSAGIKGDASGGGKAGMTPAQFHAFARKTAEQSLPRIFFDKKGVMMKDLEKKQEELPLLIFRAPYGDRGPCPYQASDFDLMLLDISDTRQAAICSMPKKHLQAGNCVTLYMFWNPQTDKAWYFTIEKPSEGKDNLLCQATAEGMHEVIGAAPAPGTELSVIMDMLED